MPLDPLLMLAGKAPEVPNPLDVATQQANLKTIGNQQQLQQQQIQGAQMQNQQTRRALDAQTQLNQSLQSNTTKDPVTGAPIVNYDGVVSSMTNAGYGKEALAFKQNINALKTSDANLQELNQRIQYEQTQHVGAMAGAIADAPDAVRPQVYQRVTQLAQQAGYLKPGQLPAQYSPDLLPVLNQMREGALSAEQQYGAKYNEGRVEAYRLRAEAALEAQQAAEQRARNAEATRRYQDTGRNDVQGRPLVLDTHTGQITSGSVAGTKPADDERARHDQAIEDIQQQNADTRAANAGGSSTGLTGNAQAVQGRFDQREQDAGRRQLDQLHQLRGLYGQALTTADGDQYIDPQTKKIAPKEMNDDIRAQLQQQLKNVTNQGVRVMRRFGWPNEFTDSDGQKAYDSAPAPQQPAATAPAAPQQKTGTAQPQYLKFANDGKGHRLGFNATTHKWEPVQQ